MKYRILASIVTVWAILGFGWYQLSSTMAEERKTEIRKDSPEPKVESQQDREVRLTEEESTEVYRSFQAQAGADDGEISSPSSAVRIVETAGGTLSFLDRGDGTVRVMAVAEQNIAFYAIISKDGIEVVSEDKDVLARFVGTGIEQNATDGADGGVAIVTGSTMDCKWVNTSFCCAVLTDAKFCTCCGVGQVGIPPSCSCVQL